MSAYQCPRCGRFYLHGLAKLDIENRPEQQRAMLSAVTRAASDSGRMSEISPEDVGRLIDSAPRWTSLLEGIDRLLLLLASRAERYSAPISFNKETDYPLICAKSEREMNELLGFAREMQLFDVQSVITLEGWKHIDALRRVQPHSRQAFVAMSFDSEMDIIWHDGLKPGIEDTKYYKAIRVDSDEHNDKIDDRIVARIKGSGLLVADFTGHKGGVYFETGLAMGLGLPVVWTCRKDHLDKAHFDTRQYNHIPWETPEELRRKLTDRLLATAVPRDRLV